MRFITLFFALLTVALVDALPGEFFFSIYQKISLYFNYDFQSEQSGIQLKTKLKTRSR